MRKTKISLLCYNIALFIFILRVSILSVYGQITNEQTYDNLQKKSISKPIFNGYNNNLNYTKNKKILLNNNSLVCKTEYKDIIQKFSDIIMKYEKIFSKCSLDSLNFTTNLDSVISPKIKKTSNNIKDYYTKYKNDFSSYAVQKMNETASIAENIKNVAPELKKIDKSDFSLNLKNNFRLTNKNIPLNFAALNINDSIKDVKNQVKYPKKITKKISASNTLNTILEHNLLQERNLLLLLIKKLNNILIINEAEPFLINYMYQSHDLNTRRNDTISELIFQNSTINHKNLTDLKNLLNKTNQEIRFLRSSSRKNINKAEKIHDIYLLKKLIESFTSALESEIKKISLSTSKSNISASRTIKTFTQTETFTNTQTSLSIINLSKFKNNIPTTSIKANLLSKNSENNGKIYSKSSSPKYSADSLLNSMGNKNSSEQIRPVTANAIKVSKINQTKLSSTKTYSNKFSQKTHNTNVNKHNHISKVFDTLDLNYMKNSSKTGSCSKFVSPCLVSNKYSQTLKPLLTPISTCSNCKSTENQIISKCRSSTIKTQLPVKKFITLPTIAIKKTLTDKNIILTSCTSSNSCLNSVNDNYEKDTAISSIFTSSNSNSMSLTTGGFSSNKKTLKSTINESGCNNIGNSFPISSSCTITISSISTTSGCPFQNALPKSLPCQKSIEKDDKKILSLKKNQFLKATKSSYSNEKEKLSIMKSNMQNMIEESKKRKNSPVMKTTKKFDQYKSEFNCQDNKCNSPISNVSPIQFSSSNKLIINSSFLYAISLFFGIIWSLN